MGEIIAPIIAITLVLLSVFVPVAFIPGISGQLFRQFAVAVSVSMLISAINALTLQPGALLGAAEAGRARRARPDALRAWAAIDRVRDGYVAVVKRLVRVAVLSLVVVAALRGRDRCFVQDHADRLPAGGGSGRVLRRIAAARRRLGQPHRGRGPAGRADHPRPTRRRGRDLGRSASTSSNSVAQSNSAFLIVHAEAVRRAHRRRTARSTPSSRGCGRKLAALHGGRGVRVQPAADHRPRHHRRLPVSARRIWQGATSPETRRSVLRGCSSRPTSSRSCARVFSTFAADTPQLYLDIDRDKAQTLGVTIIRRLQALQATLGGYYVNDFNLFGRTWQVNVQAEQRTSAARSTTSSGSTCATPTARWCRCARWPRCACVLGPAGADPLQQLSGPSRSTARPAPGVQLRRRAGRHGADLGRASCRPATATSGPAPPPGEAGRGHRPRSCSGSRCCSPICSWWRSTRAGTSRSRCCSRSSSACSAPIGAIVVRRPQLRPLRARSAWSC